MIIILNGSVAATRDPEPADIPFFNLVFGRGK